jgi:hypothetical protein
MAGSLPGVLVAEGEPAGILRVGSVGHRRHSWKRRWPGQRLRRLLSSERRHLHRDSQLAVSRSALKVARSLVKAKRSEVSGGAAAWGWLAFAAIVVGNRFAPIAAQPRAAAIADRGARARARITSLRPKQCVHAPAGWRDPARAGLWARSRGLASPRRYRRRSCAGPPARARRARAPMAVQATAQAS